MLKSEVIKVLIFASGADRRDLNELSADVWLDLLGDVSFEQAMAAVREHYRTESRPIYPADVRRLTGVDNDPETQWLRDRS